MAEEIPGSLAGRLLESLKAGSAKVTLHTGEPNYVITRQQLIDALIRTGLPDLPERVAAEKMADAILAQIITAQSPGQAQNLWQAHHG